MPTPSRHDRSLLLPLLLILVLSGCGHQDDQRKFEEQAYSHPSGFTQTDFNGNIVENRADPDDWRTAPFFQGNAEIRPAFPNPTPPNGLVTIEFDIFFSDAIMGLRAMSIHETGFIPLDDIEAAPLPPGEGRLQFSAALLSGTQAQPSGLYRVILFDRNDNVVSYGDIMVEP